jgi:hypothetical protein
VIACKGDLSRKKCWVLIRRFIGHVVSVLLRVGNVSLSAYLDVGTILYHAEI